MLNNNNYNMPDAFESLLLDTIIDDYENNIEIQKSIDMTTHYIQNADFSIAISDAKESTFFKKILSQSSKNIFNSKLLLWFLSAIILTSIAVFIFKFSTNNYSQQNAILPKTDSTNLSRHNKLDTVDKIAMKDAELISSVRKIKIDGRFQLVQLSRQNDVITTKQDAYPSGAYSYTRPVLLPFDTAFANAINKNKDDDVKIITGEYTISRCYMNLSQNAKSSSKNPDTLNCIAFYHGQAFINKKIPGLKKMTLISIDESLNSMSEKNISNMVHYVEIPKMMHAYMTSGEQASPVQFFDKKENQRMLYPFYISNTEVSNLNYQEFLFWVKAYNGFADYNYLAFDSVEQHSYEKSQAFKYTFHRSNAEVEAHFGANTIDVYPKEKVWTDNFPNSYLVPIQKHYFKHPAYSYYPVVGVSYWQALAYLDWLTWIWQSRLDKQNIDYEIEFDLPRPYEWELAAKKAWKKAKCPIVEKPINNELIFNLLVKQSDDIAYRKELGIYPKHQPSGSFISKPVLSSDECSKRSYIYHLSGNVSEWIHADYKTNYSNYEHFLLENLKDIPERDSILAWREYFNKRSVNSKGKWVMGANWYDRRVPSKNTNHYSAMYAKCFVNPDEQYATIGFRYVIRVRLKDEEKAFQKIEILGRNLPQMDYSMIKEEFNSKDDSEKWYENDIPGFLFIPMGSYNKNGKTVSVQAAYAQETEVTNFQWMLFLNDLIDNGREEELKECIPNDKQWAEKMSLEDDSLQANWKSVKNKSSLTTFPGKFIRKNNINEIVLPSFAVKPIVGISHKAAMIYAQWLSEKYGFEKRAFRLPTDIEWQWMARGGKRDSNLAFVWGGPYTRSSSGVFLANFLVSDLYYDLDSVKVDNFDLYYANKYAHKQNLEHTSDEVLKLKTDFFSIRFTVVAHFPPNDYGLVDMCGNAAEMLNEPTHTKGGSWASPAFYIRIDKEEKWNGKPSDCVGFRLVRSYL